MIEWQCYSFNELSTDEFYSIAQLRQSIFIVEQNCAYNDLDALDQLSWHLVCWNVNQTKRELVSYCRVIPPNNNDNDFIIGRVLTNKEYRNNGYARELIQRAISKIEDLQSINTIAISAQSYLTQFYESLGFVSCSKPYLEDGIEHLKMKKTDNSLQKFNQ